MISIPDEINTLYAIPTLDNEERSYLFVHDTDRDSA